MGHYTAYAKNPMDDQWYHLAQLSVLFLILFRYYFDDASVTKVPVSEVVTPSAYMLFYQRRDAPNPLKDFEFPFAATATEIPASSL